MTTVTESEAARFLETSEETTPPPEPRIAHLPALDGVRALAIVLVLFFHGGFSWAQGGFFGVDVFFVLSGFLITGLLLAEFWRNDSIGLLRFWGHRIRRLLPALLVVLLVIALYAEFVATPDVLSQLRGDALATLFYGNNWHQISGGTGYFAALNTPRPLLHTWSLSIEEQFYVIWPLVVLGVLRLTRSKTVLFFLTAALAVASAVEMSWLYHRGADTSRVYYGTDTRAQALLVGAALAILLSRHARTARHRKERGVMSLVNMRAGTTSVRIALGILGAAGLVVILTLAVASSGSTGWLYHGGFFVAAVATAALITSVAMVPASPVARLFSLRPVRYIGSISYGLYLWHWPIFVYVNHDRTGLIGWPLFVVRVAISVTVAALSLHFLELPIRRGALRGWRGWVATPVAIGLTALAVILATAGGTAAITSVIPPSTGGGVAKNLAASVTPVPGGPIRIYMVGDSEASFLSFGLGPDSADYDVQYADDSDWGCGLTFNTTLFNGQATEGTVGYRDGHNRVTCATDLTRWAADLKAFQPDVVMLADGEYEVRNQLLGTRTVHLGQPGFDATEERALRAAVAVLHSTGAPVVLLTAPYYQQPEQTDGASWPEDDPARVNEYNKLLRTVAATTPYVYVLDVNKLLDPHGHYQQFINGIDVRYADGVHDSQAGALMIAPYLLAHGHAIGAAHRQQLAHDAASRAKAASSSTTSPAAPQAPSPPGA